MGPDEACHWTSERCIRSEGVAQMAVSRSKRCEAAKLTACKQTRVTLSPVDSRPRENMTPQRTCEATDANGERLGHWQGHQVGPSRGCHLSQAPAPTERPSMPERQ